MVETDLGDRARKVSSIFTSQALKTTVIDLGKLAWKPAYFEGSLFIIHEC